MDQSLVFSEWLFMWKQLWQAQLHILHWVKMESLVKIIQNRLDVFKIEK